MNLSFMK